MDMGRMMIDGCQNFYLATPVEYALQKGKAWQLLLART